MYCLKCGRDTKSETIFCEDCLHSMEKYPVKPGAVVTLPSRNQTAALKKPPKSKQPLSVEDQLDYYKKLTFWMGLLLLILTVTLGVCVFLLTVGF